MSKPSSRWWLRQDSEQTFVAASAERLYQLLADMPRMGEWSPECNRSNGPATPPLRRWVLDLSVTIEAGQED
jgi:hypothetical protein